MGEAVIDKVNGLLFVCGDVADLGKQLQCMLEEPGLLDRLQAGAPRVKTIDEEVAELEEIYGELTSRKYPL